MIYIHSFSIYFLQNYKKYFHSIDTENAYITHLVYLSACVFQVLLRFSINTSQKGIYSICSETTPVASVTYEVLPK